MSLWRIQQQEYNRKVRGKYETLFTLANGYRGLRGHQEFSRLQRPGNFVAGVFDKHSAQVTEIVNCPNPLGFRVYVENELIDLDECELLDYAQSLDMYNGVLSGRMEVCTKGGKVTSVSWQRFVSRHDVHRWGVKYEITPVNYAGRIYVESYIDGNVINWGSDPFDQTSHFTVEACEDLRPGIALLSRTRDRNLQLVEATQLRAKGTFGNRFSRRSLRKNGGQIAETYELVLEAGETQVVEKYGVTYTERDGADPLAQAKGNLADYWAHGIDEELKQHSETWHRLWDDMDVEIEGDPIAQTGIHFNIFHLSSSAYPWDERVSIAAKGLHGEGYKGHVFWDTETFMLPFFVYTAPDTARALLMYRYNTLAGARKNAKDNGYKGAQFPWESADTGEEVTPSWGWNFDGSPLRIWTGEEEFHINADIAYAIWQYYQVTQDEEFLVDYGTEIFLDTARFWSSRLEYRPEQDRYEISRVIGPDEFHEHVDNNVYTNYLAKWNLIKAVDLANWLHKKDPVKYEQLCTLLGISQQDVNAWQVMANKIYIPRSSTSRLIEQFSGYFDLADIPITEYDDKSMPKWPNLEGRKLGETQLIKQPDVIMLMLMLSDEFDDQTQRENYRYYEARTMHKSSLSPSMYSIMGLRVGETDKAYNYFLKTVLTDLEDNQGNAAQGLHAASAGGSWQSAVHGFGGLALSADGALKLSPWIPDKWESLTYRVVYRGIRLVVKVSKTAVELTANDQLSVEVYDNIYRLEKDVPLKVTRN